MLEHTRGTETGIRHNALQSVMVFRASGDPSVRKGGLPTEDTRQEAAYLKMLAEKQRPVRVKLLSGEVLRGWIEYYDRRMVRLTRDLAPNLFIYKHEIAYIAEEGGRRAPGEIRRTTRTSAGSFEESAEPGE
jgi:host factor-I protein